jgi:hypothetical protein
LEFARERMNTTVLSKQEECRDRLAELGLNALIFTQAIQRGQAIAAGYTPNHPAICRGISQWGEIVAAIRDQLVLVHRGWTRLDQDNLPLTVNPTRTIAISVSTGDENTGIADATPSTRSTKGPRTADAVIVNALQLELFGNVPLKPEELKKESNGVMTWIFLFHRDVKTQETRFEFSRPVKMDSEGYVDVWAERIIFPALLFGTDGVLAPDLPLSPEILPEVKRKRA